ncbi:AMP-binding protein [Proteobacteria bacterium 005FR1]|nr:AMP-binding protein [Proteobacteria bacterium 005FR1]
MSEFVSLEHLLCCERRDDAGQVLSEGKILNWAQWRRRVGQWRATLDAQPAGTWALYHPSAFEFSAILFALWASGKVACIPGSNQPLIVEQLRSRVQGFIGDFEAPATTPLAAPSAQAPALESAVELDRQQAAVEIFTSGSSGHPQAIEKKLYQLAEEVATLENLWGGLAADAAVVGTVSHHHIYGLLFRVLWPLAGARCFAAEMTDYLESLNKPPAILGKFLLISSPSHLSRIPERTDWDGFRQHCAAIFSSGAPLPREASVNARKLLGSAPIEVLGSSETGGIAWRQQAADRDVAWQAIDGIAVDRDKHSGCLKIRSPYLPNTQDWYLTSDRVELLGAGTFSLHGRADRIAKVEGKRVSLSEMEQRLLAHPWVKLARVLVLEGKRTEMAAVVVLEEEGLAHLANEGRRRVNAQLQSHLLRQFERPVLPRRWRYPSELPVDNQGKVTQHDLAALFADSKQGRPLFPEVLSTARDDNVLRLLLRIPADLFYFQGHFPVAPILPGVVQIRWAEYFGRELLGLEGDFSHMEAVKFQHVIKPQQEVELKLEYRSDNAGGKLAFRYKSATGQHASGRIIYIATEDTRTKDSRTKHTRTTASKSTG